MSWFVRLKRRAAVALILSAGLGQAAAADTPAQENTEAPVVKSTHDNVDTTHERVSRAVENTAKRVDRFFGDERAFEEENESSLQISLDAITSETDGVQFDSRVKAKWVLPGTKARYRLVLESDPRESGSDSPESDPLGALDSASDYILGVEGVFIPGRWEIRPSVGLRVDLPPNPYARLRAIRYFNLDPWLARVSSTASWFNNDGTSLSANVDFDRQINEDLLFRSASGALWEEETGTTSAAQLFTLYQQLASRAKLAYDLGVTFDNDPSWGTTEYFARLRFRRLFYKNWAFVELQPQIAWPEENNYREDLSLLLRLELNFGRSYR